MDDKVTDEDLEAMASYCVETGDGLCKGCLKGDEVYPCTVTFAKAYLDIRRQAQATPKAESVQSAEVLTKIERAKEKVKAMCLGTERWALSIPARPDYDPDLIIMDALHAAEEAINAIEADRAAQRQAGRDEADESLTLLYLAGISAISDAYKKQQDEIPARYAALEEALKLYADEKFYFPRSLILLAQEKGIRLAPCYSEFGETARKALSDLDATKKHQTKPAPDAGDATKEKE